MIRGQVVSTRMSQGMTGYVTIECEFDMAQLKSGVGTFLGPNVVVLTQEEYQTLLRGQPRPPQPQTAPKAVVASPSKPESQERFKLIELE